jgi:hypothetical protein
MVFSVSELVYWNMLYPNSSTTLVGSRRISSTRMTWRDSMGPVDRVATDLGHFLSNVRVAKAKLSRAYLEPEGELFARPLVNFPCRDCRRRRTRANKALEARQRQDRADSLHLCGHICPAVSVRRRTHHYSGCDQLLLCLLHWRGCSGHCLRDRCQAAAHAAADIATDIAS